MGDRTGYVLDAICDADDRILLKELSGAASVCDRRLRRQGRHVL